MLAGSFRLVTARLIPRAHRCKQGLLFAVLILSACGGSAEPKAQGSWQTVRGPGFSFQAPAGWKIVATAKRVTASHGASLVQVATYPLVKPYTDALFGKVEVELRARMEDLARQSGERVRGTKTVTANGRRAHMFELGDGDHVDEYTFVLQGKREYLLLCRRPEGPQTDYCARLITSFAA
jgi:hypothetical protein